MIWGTWRWHDSFPPHSNGRRSAAALRCLRRAASRALARALRRRRPAAAAALLRELAGQTLPVPRAPAPGVTRGRIRYAHIHSDYIILKQITSSCCCRAVARASGTDAARASRCRACINKGRISIYTDTHRHIRIYCMIYICIYASKAEMLLQRGGTRLRHRRRARLTLPRLA